MMFSPLAGFGVAFIIAFALRPPWQESGAIRYVFTAALTPEGFLVVAILGIIGMLSFYSGDRLVDRLWRNRSQPSNAATIERSFYERDSRDAAFMLAALAASLFIIYLVIHGAVGIDFNANRASYNESLSGRGYIFVINTAAAIFLLLGFLYAFRIGRLGRPGWVAILLFGFGNLLVTNRSLITSVLYGFLLVMVINRRAWSERTIAALVLAAIAALLVLGTVLGLVRGVESYGIQGHPLQPLLFLAMTFDMAETLHDVILRCDGFAWGWPWLEDLMYTYVPREIFANKPFVYGAVRLQHEFIPGSLPSSGVPTATYPLGIFGEAYANFGGVGVATILFGTGAFCRSCFLRVLAMKGRSSFRVQDLIALNVLALLIGNTLGYIRSFGWFLASLLFLGVFVPVCYLILNFASRRALAAPGTVGPTRNFN